MLKETFNVWQKSWIDLGLFTFLMFMGLLVAVLLPFLLFGQSLLGLAITALVGFVGGLAYQLYWCAGYIAVDNLTRTGETNLSAALLTIPERMGAIIGGMAICLVLSSIGSFFFLIPTILISIFSLIYLPFLTLERTGPIECLTACAKAIPENIPTCLSGLGILSLLVVLSTLSIVALGFGSTLLFADSPMIMIGLIAGTMTLFLSFVFIPVYWIVGTLLYQKIKPEHSFDAAYNKGPQNEEPPVAPADSDGFAHKTSKPMPAPITVDLDSETFATPNKNESFHRSKRARVTQPPPDSSEFLGLPVEDTLFQNDAFHADDFNDLDESDDLDEDADEFESKS